MNILGISAFYHDSAACLVRDGRIVAAAQEERFSRKKHDSSFPKRAIEYSSRVGEQFVQRYGLQLLRHQAFSATCSRSRAKP